MVNMGYFWYTIDKLLQVLIVPAAAFLRGLLKLGSKNLPLTFEKINGAGVSLTWYSRDYVPIELSKDTPVVVDFNGGLGAQVITAAIYYYLLDSGYDVYVDDKYFKQEARLAPEVGQQCSIWNYELDAFGIPLESFKRLIEIEEGQYSYIGDGLDKTLLFRDAASNPKICERFPLNIDVIKEIHNDQIKILLENTTNYCAVHLRKGDYVNSPVHKVLDEFSYVPILKKISSHTDTIVLFSDGTFSEHFREVLTTMFTNYHFCSTEVSAFASHQIMRRANYLVCANSQLSLSAGMMSSGLCFFPTSYFSDGYHQAEAIHMSKKYFSFYSY